MTRLRYVCLGLISAALGSASGLLLAGGSAVALTAEQAQGPGTRDETVRSEVGNLLQAAQELIRANRYKEALAKIEETERVRDKTPYELYVIDRLRGAAAAGAGDTEVAIRSFESAIASGRLSQTETLQIMEALATLQYRNKNYADAIAWALRYGKEGGTGDKMNRLLIQAYYLNNDFPNAERELRSELQADERSGRVPAEDRLQLLANCYLKQADTPGHIATLEQLVTYYPKKEYWAELVYRIETRAGFAPRLGLDAYRLKLALGIPITAGQFVEATELALQAGFPAEAKSFIDRGFAAGVLGSGADAERQRRLRDLATKGAADDQKTLAQDEAEASAAKDGTALVDTGFAYVVGGQLDRGIDLMERGIRKGGLKHPDDAALHLGIAYLIGGHKEQAIRTFNSVRGADGCGDLARVWAIYAHRLA